MALKYKDYYEVLGEPRNAGAAAIKKAYRKRAREYHPDINKEPGAQERFQEISEEVVRHLFLTNDGQPEIAS